MSLATLLAGEDVEFIAQKLLGVRISSVIDGVQTSGVIVETEAYKAPLDKGSHAYQNKRTKRTSTLFGESGIAYIYLCYGIHHLVNVVTGPKDVAHAVLIRAIEPLEGLEEMLKRRKQKKLTPNLTNGPGKLTQALGISTAYNGVSYLSKDTKISLQIGATEINDNQILKSPRVGIAYAKECALWPWRFRIKDHRWTSLPHEVEYGT